jgi:type I restriction enzyme S subunit
MAGEWKETSLAAVMDVKHGFAFPGENIRDEPPGDILLTPGNFAIGGGFKGDKFKYFDGEVPEDYVLKEGELVLTMTDLSKQADTLGYPAIVPKPRGPRFLHNQRLGKVLIKRGAELDRGFLFYLLRTAEYRNEVLASATGTTVKHTSPGRILAHKASFPPLAEQKAIAAVLGALDDKIELNRRMNATLEATARALFQSWFVDFDPVRAKLDGRPPAALDPATAALFPASFQESSLGPIPRGWDVCPLSEKIQLLSGGTPKTSEPTYWDGDIPWYSVRDAPSETDVWVIHTDKHVTKLGIANSAAQVFPEKTTIISARGTVGKLALTAVPMAMNQSCYGVRGIAGYGDYFTYYSLREATAQLQQRTHGTVFDTITTETFKTLDCIFPTPKITAAFDKLVEPLLGQIRANLHQSRTLATLRDTLLPKLLSGELTIPSEVISRTCP